MTDARPLLRELLGGPVVAYHPRLAHFVGGVKAAVMLSQLYYLSNQQQDPDAPFAAGVDALEVSTGLSVKEQATARDALLERGLVSVTRRGVPCRYFYRVDLGALVRLIAGQLPLPGVPAVSPSRPVQSRPKGESGVAPSAPHAAPPRRRKERIPQEGGTAADAAGPPTTHPAVLACRRSASRIPGAAWRKEIIAAVGDDPAALARWETTVKEWVGRGHNPTAWSHMIDVFRNGWRNGNGRKPATGQPYSAAEDVAAFRARKGIPPKEATPK